MSILPGDQVHLDTVTRLLDGAGGSAGRGVNLPSGQLTLLFSDIEGSTQLVELLGERYGCVLNRHFELLRRCTFSEGGQEVVGHGDSYFAVFDRPISAVAAAINVQRLLYDEPWPEGVHVRVRMGLHTGAPQLVADRAIGYVGLDVHRAARICAAAHGGQILMSSATSGAVCGELPAGVALRDLGTHRMKDIRFPETISDLIVDGLPSQFGPIRSIDNRPNNLPSAMTAFIGRVTEKADLRALLLRDDVRIVTLTGAAGTGKTRLSIEVASALLDVFTDGVFQVLLAAVTSPRLVPPTIAQTLGMPEFPGRPILEGLKYAIGKQHMLLVIDNFEQVIGATQSIVDLLQACPRLKVLVTSREVLGISAEKEFPLPPLRIPDEGSATDAAIVENYDAVKLFIERARDIRSDFRLTAENAASVVEICRRLDGLPLAIELAASRLRILEPAALLDRLSQRLEALGRADQGLKGRHQTLRNAISWSYDLLDEPQQQLFCRISVFSGGFKLEAAQAVCMDTTDDLDVLDNLASLTRKSLIARETIEGEPRLRMLETVREYAREQLKESGQYKELRGRHMEYMLALAELSAPTLVGPDQRKSVSRMLAEAENVRAALEYALEIGEFNAASRFLKSLLWLWISRGQFTEGETWVSRTLQRTASARGTRERATVLDVGGWLRMMSGDWNGALPFFQECRPIYERLEMVCEGALASMLEGITLTASSDDADGVEKVLSALARLRELNDIYGVGLALTALGEGARLRAEHEKAQACFEEALSCMRSVQNGYWIGALLENLAHVRLKLRDWRGASLLLKEALELAREYDYPMMINHYIAAMGEVALVRGLTADAARLFGAANSFLKSLGVKFEPTDQSALEQDMAAARDQLGASAYDACFNDGAQWNKSQAIAATFVLRS